MRYPVRIEYDGEYYVVSFRDFAGLVGRSRSFKGAFIEAKRILDECVISYIEGGRVLPVASRCRGGECGIWLGGDVIRRVRGDVVK